MGLDLITSSFLGLRDKLHHIALQYLRSDEDVQDALQDTWLKLSDSDVATSQEAKNKLVAVLRNTCIDRIRKAKAVSINDIGVSEMPHYCVDIEDVEHLEQLLQRQLTPLQQRIFNLIAHDGCDYGQIAEQLSMNVEAVRMNMCRIRKKISETYKKLNYETKRNGNQA